jgi:hypothetical protein
MLILKIHEYDNCIIIIRVPVCVPLTRLRPKFAPKKPYQLLGQLNFYPGVVSFVSCWCLRGWCKCDYGSTKLQNVQNTSRKMPKVASRGDVAASYPGALRGPRGLIWSISWWGAWQNPFRFLERIAISGADSINWIFRGLKYHFSLKTVWWIFQKNNCWM